MLPLVLILASLPGVPPEALPASSPVAQPPTVGFTATRLAAASGALLATAPIAAGTTSSFMYGYSNATTGTAQALALSAGFSSALVAIPWAATDFRFTGPGMGFRAASLSLATTAFASSTVMLFTSSPLVGDGGVSDIAFQLWAFAQGAASTAALLLMSWATFQYGRALETEHTAEAVRMTLSMRVLMPASGGTERPVVAGVMGRF